MSSPVSPTGDRLFFRTTPEENKESEAVKSEREEKNKAFCFNVDAVPFVPGAQMHTTRKDLKAYDEEFPPLSGLSISKSGSKPPSVKPMAVQKQKVELHSQASVRTGSGATARGAVQGQVIKRSETSRVKAAPEMKRTAVAKDLCMQAKALHEAGRSSEALRYITKLCTESNQRPSCVGTEPVSLGYYFHAMRMKAFILKKQGNFPESIKILETMKSDYEKHYDKFPDRCDNIDFTKCCEQLFLTLNQSGQSDRATQLASEVVNSTGGKTVFLLPETDHEKFRKDLESQMGDACKSDTKYIKSYYLQAMNCWKEGKCDEALSAVKMSIDLQKKFLTGTTRDMPHHIKLSLSNYESRYIRWLIASGDLERAEQEIESFETFFQEAGRNRVILSEDYFFDKVMFFSQQKKFKKAIKALEQGVIKYSDSVLLKHAELRIECDQCISNNQDIPEQLYTRVVNFTRRSETYQNQLHLLKLDYYIFLRELVANEGIDDRLEKILSKMLDRCQRLIDEYPDNSGAWSLKGHLLTFTPQANSDETHKCHTRARELQPHSYTSRKGDDITIAFSELNEKAKNAIGYKFTIKHDKNPKIDWS